MISAAHMMGVYAMLREIFECAICNLMRLVEYFDQILYKILFFYSDLFV